MIAPAFCPKTRIAILAIPPIGFRDVAPDRLPRSVIGEHRRRAQSGMTGKDRGAAQKPTGGLICPPSPPAATSVTHVSATDRRARDRGQRPWTTRRRFSSASGTMFRDRIPATTRNSVSAHQSVASGDILGQKPLHASTLRAPTRSRRGITQRQARIFHN